MAETAVRVLGAEEWALYREVRLAALADSPSAFGSTLRREREFSVHTWRERAAGGNVLVAERDGEVRGLVAVVPREGPLAGLVSLWVRPDSRRHGTGHLLVGAAVDLARERGFSRVRLWVVGENAGAERLYTRHGFRPTGEVQPLGGEEGPMEFAMELAMVRDPAAAVSPPRGNGQSLSGPRTRA